MRSLCLSWGLPLVILGTVCAEEPRFYFDRGAERFIRSDNGQALGWVSNGLALHPDDLGLLALKQLLEQQEQPQSGPSQQQPQPSASQETSPSQPKPDDTSGEPPPQEGPPQADSESQETTSSENRSDKDLPGKEMTREEAAVLLDAMRQQEQALRRQMALEQMRSNMSRLPPVERDW